MTGLLTMHKVGDLTSQCDVCIIAMITIIACNKRASFSFDSITRTEIPSNPVFSSCRN